MTNTFVAIILIYRLLALAGTAYLVQVYNWSGWWFLLTIITFIYVDDAAKKEQPK